MGNRHLTLVAGQGDMGGGEQMLLRIGEAAQYLHWTVRVLGPTWGELGEACRVRDFDYVPCKGADRRTYALTAAAHLARRNVGLVWANGAFPALLATPTPNPLVVHLHQQPSWFQRLTITAAMARARAVFVPSESMRRGATDAQVLLNWTQDFPVLAREPDPESFTVAYLGRLSVDKGVDTLAVAVSAMARELPNLNVRLLVAGDARFVPEESARAVQRALQDCAADVVRLGWAEPAKVFAASDVAVVPSRWAEPFGLVAAEAMAMGCPLVVSDSGALPEVVGPGYPWVFRAGDSKSLREMLGEVRNDGADRFVVSMRERWEQLFSPPAGRARLESVLRSLS